MSTPAYRRALRRRLPITQASVLAELTILLLLFLVPQTVGSVGIEPHDVLRDVNVVRSSHHLPTLEVNPALTAAAQRRADEIARSGYAAHTRPSGAPFESAIDRRMYPFERVGENIAIGFLREEPVIRAWSRSPAHRRNLLQPHFRDAGIGVAHGRIDGAPTTVIVQLGGVLQEPILRGWTRLPSALPFA